MTEKERNPMFRYLEKYVGTYRVKTHLDPTTNDFPKDANGKIPDTYDELYIECSKGEIRHTYRNGILCWMIFEKIKTANNVANRFKNANIEFEFDECGEDAIIYFKEEDLKKVAHILKPSTYGKGIKPFSVRNLPNNKQFVGEYKIPAEDIAKLDKVLEKMDKTQKMLFMKKCIKEFDDVIMEKMGKTYKLKEKRDASGLKPKMFIHHIGLWEDFVKFAKKKAKESNVKN